MRNPPRRRRFNYAGAAAGLIEGERKGAKKTGQRDRMRRNWDAHGERRTGCRRVAGDYRNGGADAGPGRRVTEKTCLRYKSLETDSLSRRPDASTTNAEVVAAVQFAIKVQAATPEQKAGITLVELLSARQQVVAGMNYRLRIKVKFDGKDKETEAVVWRKLSGEHELTSWTWK